jgi:hypothetical protein
MLIEHVDIGEVGKDDAVAERPREADQAPLVVEADHARGLAHQPLHDLPGTTLGPVGVIGDEVVHGVDVDAIAIVVELVAARQVAPHVKYARARPQAKLSV